MSYQTSFLRLSQTKKLRCERFLDEMDTVIPWNEFINEIKPYYQLSQSGRKKKDLRLMLKIYFLQQWYNLSDPGAEEAIYDRNSFQKFLDIDLLNDTVPDETTILNFRHLLEENQLPKKFFQIVNQIFEQRDLTMKKGTSVDATIIKAPSSTKNKAKKRDPEMSSTKKGNTWHFGMKAHIGVDSQSGIIHSLETTTASVSDRDKFKKLLHGDEQAIFGDKGYYSELDKRQARQDGIYFGVLDKAKRGYKLSASQIKQNKKKSSVRSKVEHPFQVLKCQWGYTKVRYKGLFKNSMQLHTLFSLVNLFRMRKQLLAIPI